MKIRWTSNCIGLAMAGCLVFNLGFAQDKSKGDAKGAAGAPGMDEMMKKMEELAAPGPEHKALDSLAGDWVVESRFIMAPDAPPTVSKGTSKKKWILGGRFVQEELSAEFMGKPFQGVGITGYDKIKKKYVGSWMDSMGTSLSTMEGSADSGGKIVTLTGTMDDPMTGQMNKPIKYVLRIEGPNKHILEMHDPSLGEKSKMGEVLYTRK
jgi:hypothetical protein